MNAKKVYGCILCLAGIFCVKAKSFFPLDGSFSPYLYSAGIIIAFAGLAVYASGITGREVKRIRVCRNCFCKNDAARETCRKCKKPLRRKEGEP